MGDTGPLAGNRPDRGVEPGAKNFFYKKINFFTQNLPCQPFSNPFSAEIIFGPSQNVFGPSKDARCAAWKRWEGDVGMRLPTGGLHPPGRLPPTASSLPIASRSRQRRRLPSNPLPPPQCLRQTQAPLATPCRWQEGQKLPFLGIIEMHIEPQMCACSGNVSRCSLHKKENKLVIRSLADSPEV